MDYLIGVLKLKRNELERELLNNLGEWRNAIRTSNSTLLDHYDRRTVEIKYRMNCIDVGIDCVINNLSDEHFAPEVK